MRFDKIEIHFRTRDQGGKEVPRTVTITRNSKVDGIILTSSKPRLKDIPDIEGLTVDGEVAPGDGPGVCYDAGGAIQCW